MIIWLVILKLILFIMLISMPILYIKLGLDLMIDYKDYDNDKYPDNTGIFYRVFTFGAKKACILLDKLEGKNTTDSMGPL